MFCCLTYITLYQKIRFFLYQKIRFFERVHSRVHSNFKIGFRWKQKIINKNYNSSLEVELNSISKEVINNSEKDILSDDLTVLVIGK